MYSTIEDSTSKAAECNAVDEDEDDADDTDGDGGSNLMRDKTICKVSVFTVTVTTVSSAEF